MNKWVSLLLVAVFTITMTTGCGSMKKWGKKGSDSTEEIDIAAIAGEDIPLDEIPADMNFVEPEEMNAIGIFEDIHFAYDKSRVRSEDYPTLNRIADWLDNNPRIYVMIEGHCDERGSNEYNMALGEQRALSTRTYLINLGIDSSRLYTVSYGEEKPLDPDHSEAAWSQNRRVHFLLGE